MFRTLNATLVSIFALVLLCSSAIALTAAGAKIQNKASASYRFVGDNTVYTATSNIVTTVIQQVAGVSMQRDQAKYVVAGKDVFFPHVIKNTGNGADSYNLAVSDVASGDDFNFDDIEIFADANHDGIADNLNQPLTKTPVLAMDEEFYFVVVATAPAAATDAQVGKLTLTSSSNFAIQNALPAVETSNTNTATITNLGVVDVTKSMNLLSGASPSGGADSGGTVRPDVYTVTLSYQNLSNTPVTNLELTDTPPAGMLLSNVTSSDHSAIADTVRWSAFPSDVLTDADDGLELTNQINVCVNQATCSGQFKAVIASVPAGVSGSISFEVKIDGGLTADEPIYNTAAFKYAELPAGIDPIKTNQVPFTIEQNIAVVMNGDAASNINGTAEPVTVASVGQGGSVLFDNYVWNTGNAEDSFNITADLAGSGFPQGTIFEFLKSDGATPLVDTSNDGVPDTGRMLAGAVEKIVMRATLPSNATSGTNFDVTLWATSTANPVVQDSIINRLGAITGSSVDLKQAASTDLSVAALGTAAINTGPHETMLLKSGTQGVFSLFVENTSDRTDNYALYVSSNSTFTPPTALLAGWKVKFYDDGGAGDCSTISNPITQTGILNAGESKQVCAVLTVPDTAAPMPAPVEIHFQAVSPLTGSADTLFNKVNILADTTSALNLEPNQHAQVKPGLEAVHHHILQNLGNVGVEGINATLTDTFTAQGWVSEIYLDVNSDTKLDAGDTILKDLALNPQEVVSVLVRVIAPSNAIDGSSNVTKVVINGFLDDGDNDPATLTGAPLTSSVSDITRVSNSVVAITKHQALDADCNGTPDGPNACLGDNCYTVEMFSASQNQCIIYRLTARNNGVTPAHSVRINDIAPLFTTFYKTSGFPTLSSSPNIGGNITNVTHGGDGVIVGGSTDGAAVDLPAGGTMILHFAVKLD